MQRAADPGTSQQDIINLSDGDAETSSRDPICNVCGETPAAMHYGAVACVGCKGFFRRALMRADQLECLTDGSCVINKDLRTNCRSCRFQKCLKAGMKPGAVRPNREVSSKQKKKALAMPDESVDCTPTSSRQKDDWLKKMPVEMRTILMNLLNIEAKIMKTRTFPFLCFPGDTNTPASNLYPLKIKTLQELVEDPTKLKGKRSEMRYEPYRMAKNDELCSVAYRRVIAAIDWIENLAELMGGLNIEDKMILIKSCFAPLMVFKFTTRTAEVAKDQNILCLCNFCFVPRNISSAFSDSYHLGNGLVGRALDELVEPFRTYGLREEEIVCVSAMIAINPLTKGLSDNAFNKCVELRNKIQDTLFHIVKEARLSPHPPICYGHLLLSLPIVTSIANSMCENLQFAQTFSAQGEVPLLTDLFGCFPVDPLEDLLQMDDLALSPTSSNILKQTNQREKSTQTETAERRMSRKRRMDEPRSPSSFSLLRAPASFTLTEMFDDIHRESYSPERLNTSYPSTSALNQRQQVQMNPTVGRTYSLPSSVNMLPADNGATNPYQHITQHAPPSQQSQSYYPNCYSSQHWEQPPPNHHQYNGYQ